MAIHIKQIVIDTFRGVKNLDIQNLGEINIITGDNNSGKTSVLEVIDKLVNPEQLSHWINSRNSSVSPYERAELLFDVNSDRKLIKYSTVDINDTTKTLEIEAKYEEEELTLEDINNIDKIGYHFKKLSITDGVEDEFSDFNLLKETVGLLHIYFKVNNCIVNDEKIYDFQTEIKKSKKEIANKIIYVSATEHSKSNLFLSEILDNPMLYEEMINVLKLFDDGIISINADKSVNNFYRKPVYKILSKNNKTAIPLNSYGDGIKKAILLLSAVVAAKDGILLLDEFEIAIHTSAMNEIFAWILNTCIKLNVQLFMTSHSEEAIDKVLKCSPDLKNKIRLITLYSKEEKTVARVLDGEKAIKLKDNLGVELR
ncbi:MAG: AAA family ATPase [Clostridium sp.]